MAPAVHLHVPSLWVAQLASRCAPSGVINCVRPRPSEWSASSTSLLRLGFWLRPCFHTHGGHFPVCGLLSCPPCRLPWVSTLCAQGVLFQSVILQAASLVPGSWMKALSVSAIIQVFAKTVPQMQPCGWPSWSVPSLELSLPCSHAALVFASFFAVSKPDLDPLWLQQKIRLLVSRSWILSRSFSLVSSMAGVAWRRSWSALWSPCSLVVCVRPSSSLVHDGVLVRGVGASRFPTPWSFWAGVGSALHFFCTLPHEDVCGCAQTNCATEKFACNK